MSTHRNYCERCASAHESIDCPPTEKRAPHYDDALHMMEGKGGEGVQDISGHTWLGMRAAGWVWNTPNPTTPLGRLRNYASHWSTGPKDAERLYRESDIRKLLDSIPAPKTALSHFADEVEASGEAEKHAYPPLPEKSYLGDDASYGYDASDMRDYIDADRAAMRHDLDKFKALYTAAFEGLVRERGITKELASIARQWAALDSGSWLTERYENEKTALLQATVAALAKVQS